MLIAGDIGGTKTDLAIFSERSGRACATCAGRECTARIIPACRPW